MLAKPKTTMNIKQIGVIAGLVLLGTLIGVAAAGYKDAMNATPAT